MPDLLPPDGRLTAAGWPRPLSEQEGHGRLPVPWVSPTGDLAIQNLGRYRACASGAVCAVCGLGYQPDDRAFIILNRPNFEGEVTPERLAEGSCRAMDNAVMHRRCIRLAVLNCPELRALYDAGELVFVDVRVGSVEMRLDEGEGHHGAIEPSAWCPGEDCRLVTPAELGLPASRAVST